MAALGRSRSVIFQPGMMQVRHRKSIDVRKPPPAPLLRRLIQEITVPIELKKAVPVGEYCQTIRQQKSSVIDILNRYEEFVLKQTKEVLKDSRMMLVYQYLPMSSNDKRKIVVELAQNDFHLLRVQNKIMKRAIANTRMANLDPLLIGFNDYVVSRNTNVADLLKCTNKMPQMILLGGMIDNHLLTKDGILECSKIPSLDHIRGQLVSILGSKMSETRRLLGHHQSQLSTNLTQLIKQNTEETEET